MSAPGGARRGARWGDPPWRLDVPVPSRAPPAGCEVAIVGAGLTGLAAALALARRGVRVAVLEAHRVGAGASGCTGGVVLEGTHVGPRPEADRCLPGLEQMIERERIACGLELGGCWELTHRRPGAPPEGRALGWRDHGCELVVTERVPGGTLDPGALLEGLARAALAAGASLHEGAAVRRLRLGPPLRLETREAVVEADGVILALNAYTASLLALPEAPEPLFALAVCTEPLPAAARDAIGLQELRPFYTADLPYLWGRPLAGGRLLLGGSGLLAARARLARLDLARGESRRRMQELATRLRGLHPALERVGIASSWGGPVAILRQRAPLLGRHPAAERLIVTGGYTGHGIALAMQAGELAAGALAEARPLPAWGELGG